jgi:hypothetical protein
MCKFNVFQWLMVGAVGLAGCAKSESPPPTNANPEVKQALPTGPLVLSKGFGVEKRQGETTGTTKNETCKLWVGDQPAYSMTLTSNMVGLRVKVVSEGGAAAVVRFAKGTFCSKEAGDSFVVERGSWSKEKYDIFIGVPEKGKKVKYVMEVVEK